MIAIYGNGRVGKGIQKLLDIVGKEYIILDDASMTQSDIQTQLQTVDMIIPAPGINPSHMVYTDYSNLIVGEYDLCDQILSEKLGRDRYILLGVTGTDGKSTTTWILYSILKQITDPNKYKIHIGGNFEPSFADLASDVLDVGSTDQHIQHIFVLEISSFAAHNISTAQFAGSIWTNFSPDHLNRHSDMQDYRDSKHKLADHSDIVVVHPDTYDRITHDHKYPIIPYIGSAQYLPGTHNNYNIGSALDLLNKLAADNIIDIQYNLTDIESIASIIDNIRGLPHRLDMIAQLDGRCIYDDLKSSSSQSLGVALGSMTRPVVLICGGSSKGEDFQNILDILSSKVAYAIIHSNQPDVFVNIFVSLGIQYVVSTDMSETVNLAMSAMYEYNTDLLYSPGCASHDLYIDYKDRAAKRDRCISRHIHSQLVIVGAGGIGTSAIGFVSHQLGIEHIIAIDSSTNQVTQTYSDMGIDVIIGHGIYTPKAGDIVIYSDAAVSSHEVNTALMLARQGLCKTWTYFEFVGEVSHYFQTISIAGTHGKSTTTSMLMDISSQLGGRFAMGICGALYSRFGLQNFIINHQHISHISNIRKHILYGDQIDLNTKSDLYFIIEADEYNRHFQLLDTDIAAITNISRDHVEVYPSEHIYHEAFTKFAGGAEHIFALQDYHLHIDSDIHICNIVGFDFRYIFGDYNIENASLAYHIARYIYPEVDSQIILGILNNYAGIWRRMEYIGDNPLGKQIYSDYGHHPEEIGSVVTAFSRYRPDQKINIIIQPHQLKRLSKFMHEYIDISKSANINNIVIYQIYAARENQSALFVDISQSLGVAITNIDQLGEIFAQTLGGSYISDIQELESYISTSDHTTIVFNASGLDYQLRKFVNKQE